MLWDVLCVLLACSAVAALTNVIRPYYRSQCEALGRIPRRRAGGIDIETVDWTEEIIDYVRSRSQRRPGDLDIEPEWATEVAFDPMRLVGEHGSENGPGEPDAHRGGLLPRGC